MRNFRRILHVNAVLDVGYMLSGTWLMLRFKTQRERRSMGVGIIVQGLWLFSMIASWRGRSDVAGRPDKIAGTTEWRAAYD